MDGDGEILGHKKTPRRNEGFKPLKFMIHILIRLGYFYQFPTHKLFGVKEQLDFQ